MNRRIIVNNKEFKMEKMSADTYMEYLELAEKIETASGERASKRYSREEIEAMMLFICKAYGNQFTIEELKDTENGLDAAGIIIEFNMIDMSIAEEMNSRMEKMMKNFQNGK
jgi:dsDNA-binding SOS-regulon protein